MKSRGHSILNQETCGSCGGGSWRPRTIWLVHRHSGAAHQNTLIRANLIVISIKDFDTESSKKDIALVVSVGLPLQSLRNRETATLPQFVGWIEIQIRKIDR